MAKLSKKEKAIHDEFQKYGKNAKQWMRKCVLMLPTIESERIWEKKGFGSIYEYAAKIARMTQHMVNEGLRILEKVENMPSLRKVVEKKGIWAVTPVLKVATPENQEIWAQKAMIMSRSTLRVCVSDFEKCKANKGTDEGMNVLENLDKNGHAGVAKNAGEPVGKPNLFEKMAKINDGIDELEGARMINLEEIRERHYGIGESSNNVGLSGKIMISVEVSHEIAERIKKAKGKESWEDLMQEFLEFKEAKEKQFKKELEKEKPAPVKTISAYRPAKIDKFVKKRAKGMCEEFGCTKPGVQVHHTEPFAITKEHDPDTLKLLCKDHHDIAHSNIDEDGVATAKAWSLVGLVGGTGEKGGDTYRIEKKGKKISKMGSAEEGRNERLRNLINLKYFDHKWAGM